MSQAALSGRQSLGGDKHLLKRGVCDEKEGSGRQIPMSINMPQLIFQRADREFPSQMSQAALSGGQSLGEGGLLLGGGGNFYLGGGGGGGEIPGFPPPLYETLTCVLSVILI